MMLSPKLNKEQQMEFEYISHQWKELGLPEIELTGAYLRALHKKDARDKFAYFCGIAYRIINRTKRGSVGETVYTRGHFPWS